MMREAARARPRAASPASRRDLIWQRGGRVGAHAARDRATGDEARTGSRELPRRARRAVALADFDAVLMRKDPPFDSEYFYATHLLEQAEREGARVFNRPAALRDHPGEARDPRVPAVHRADAGDARREPSCKRFHAEHRDIILKPLDGMGGMGIFRVGADGLNLGSIVETLNERRRADRDGAALPARDRQGRQAHPGDRRQAGAASCWRAFRRAARSAATSRSAARAWRSRSRRATARSPSTIGPMLARARPAAGRPGRDRRLPDRDQRHQPDLLPGDHASRPASTSPKMFIDALEAALA